MDQIPPRPQPEPDRMQDIRARLDDVLQARNISILNPDHLARWDDVEWLLEQLNQGEAARIALRQERDDLDKANECLVKELEREGGTVDQLLARIGSLTQRGQQLEAELAKVRP